MIVITRKKGTETDEELEQLVREILQRRAGKKRKEPSKRFWYALKCAYKEFLEVYRDRG